MFSSSFVVKSLHSLFLDMAVLAGAKPEKCMAKYGSLPLKSSYYLEMSLRILLMALDSAANRHGRYIEPWISLSVSTVRSAISCNVLLDTSLAL